MKKISIILLCMFSINLFAQVEHLKFMGIPIDGKIKTFQKQLLKKKIYKDKQYDQISQLFYNDMRFYYGIFAGIPSEILVYINKETKMVFQVKVIMKQNSNTDLHKKYEDLLNDYKNKYNNSTFKKAENDINDVTSDNKESTIIVVPDSSTSNYLGMIIVTKEKDDYKNKYDIVIQYIDGYNYDSSSKEIDDL